MQALDALLNRVSVPRLLDPAPTQEQPRPQGCLLSPRCPYVQESCRAQRPGLDPKSNSLARCFYPLNQEVA